MLLEYNTMELPILILLTELVVSPSKEEMRTDNRYDLYRKQEEEHSGEWVM